MERKGVAIFGEVVIDFDRMEIRRSGRIVPSTALEFRILKFFVDNPHCVFSRAELMQAVWPERERVNGRTVDNFVGHYGGRSKKILLILSTSKRYTERDAVEEPLKEILILDPRWLSLWRSYRDRTLVSSWRAVL